MNKSNQGKNMTYAVSINSSGQATIPKTIRELLGVVPGENRLTFDVVKGKVILGREASKEEQLLSATEKIRKTIEEEKKNNPIFAANFKKYSGMTYREFTESYEDTEEDKKEFEEKYGIKL